MVVVFCNHLLSTVVLRRLHQPQTKDRYLVFFAPHVVLVRVWNFCTVVAATLFSRKIVFSRYNPPTAPHPFRTNNHLDSELVLDLFMLVHQVSYRAPCHSVEKTGARSKFVGRAPERLAAAGRPGAVLRLGFERRLSFPGGVRGEYYYRGTPGGAGCCSIAVFSFPR